MEAFVAERFETELRASARAVLAAAEFDAGGVFSVDPPPADPRFAVPGSGWAWQVSDGDEALARAPSLLSGDLGPNGAGPDPRGAALDRLRLDFTAPGDGRPLSVVVTMPTAERLAAASAVTRPLALALTALGAALTLAQLVAVTRGLRGLDALRTDFAALRRGALDRLPEPRAPDLRPLAAEVNRLIAAQAETVARARAHAGDLAHTLKTPLAALRNAAPEHAALIDRMDRAIRWRLQRARAAATQDGIVAHAPVAEVADDLRLVLGAEAARRGVALRIDAPDGLLFRGEREDLTEMLGALLENAVKWARGVAALSAAASTGALLVTVEDDGPGVPETEREGLLARGARLDEAAPGHGLGLAIVVDLARLYEGRLTLGASPLGGLSARLELPLAVA